MNVLDLFSGIGGFSLGLERAGMRTVAFCEIEPYARAVLAKHWPHVPCYADVRELTPERLRADGISVDLICGGFPCQDISVAGSGAGLAGAKSGLWHEYWRLIDEVRPRWAIIENVSALRSRGLEAILGQLAEIGYDAEWHCVPARALGAPHRRDRLWIIAYPERRQLRQQSGWSSGTRRPDSSQPAEHGEAQHLANTCSSRLATSEFEVVLGARRWEEGRAATECSWWATEPDVGRVANGVPSRVDRLRCLGNAVVPQIVEAIGRAIVNSHR